MSKRGNYGPTSVGRRILFSPVDTYDKFQCEVMGGSIKVNSSEVSDQHFYEKINSGLSVFVLTSGPNDPNVPQIMKMISREAEVDII